MPLCFLKLQIFEVLSVVKKVVLKRHVVRIPFPVNLAVNLRSVYIDQDEGRKQPRTKNVVHLVTGLKMTLGSQMELQNNVLGNFLSRRVKILQIYIEI